MVDVTIPIAFLAGIVSFLSPCILPLLPAFISYLSGVSISDKSPPRARIFLNSLSFVMGFALVFSLLGVLLATVLAGAGYDIRVWLSRLGGIVIALFGVYLLGIVRLPFLEKEHKLKPRRFKYSYLTSFVFGVAFAAGWTPCVGPALGAILTLAFVSPGSAFGLLLAFSLGLGVPFLVTGLFISRASELIKKSQRFMRPFRIIMGILLIVLGIMVFTGSLALLSNFFFMNNLGIYV
ncbi:MAG: cytochrome C biogenesis protein [Candidatus Aenigmarchaeota archaeon]|nr:cytochrome C biogenesis protein [Candidatus Aenigmarchaeota archaeon]